MNMISGKTLGEKLPTKISKASPVFARLSQLLVSNRLHYLSGDCSLDTMFGLFYARTSISSYRNRRALLKATSFFYRYLSANSAGMSHEGQKGGFFLNIKYVYIHCLTRESCLSIASYTDAGVLSANAVSDYCTFQNPWLQFKKLNFPSACFVQVDFSH